MRRQPLEITPPIYNFINSRLKEENSEKCRDKDLQERNCAIERVYGWHATTLILNASPLSILFAPQCAQMGVPRKLSAQFAAAKRAPVNPGFVGCLCQTPGLGLAFRRKRPTSRP